MPELPEVEVMTRNLRRWAGRGPLRSLEILDGKLLREAVVAPEELGGRPVSRVWRRGKYSLLELGDLSVVLHFRMTGKLIRLGPGDQPKLRALFDFGRDRSIGFRDPRRFGTLDILRSDLLDPWFASKGLGPEPWPKRRDGPWWAERFARARGPIKVALLNQRRVSGLGNIAGSEICWRARIDPAQPTSRLRAEHWAALASASWDFCEETVLAEDRDEIVYINEGAGAPNPFAVYAHAGEPCPRCGEAIRRSVQAGRSTFSCARCQG